MKYEQYLSLIKRLEISAATSRRLYELRVLGLGLLGYAYMVGLIILALAVPLLLILLLIINAEAVLKLLLWTAKLWWVVLPGLAVYFGFVGGAVKALFAKVPEPEGRVLTEQEAPELHAFVTETCRKLKADRPKTIFVTDEFNAAVGTVPRIGLFGRKVYMFLGLPLMKALSPDQFRAVLTHEIGHISGKHGGFGKWAFQLRSSWGLFIESQELQNHKFDKLYKSFVEWFFPYFQAYSFVLMREHEKEADQYSAELSGAKPLGEALILLHTRRAELDQVFWADIEKENRERAEQSPNIFSRMLSALSVVETTRDLKTLEKAVKVPTDYNDSHPSLAERLKLLGYWNGEGMPDLPKPAGQTASEYYLGPVADSLSNDFETKWTEEIGRMWKVRHDEYIASRERFDALESKSADDELTTEELIEKAGLLARQDGNSAAIALLRMAVEKDPDNPEANFNLGGVLLSEDDEAGLKYVDHAMNLDKKWKYAASDIAFQYLRSKGMLEEAKPYAAVLDGYDDEVRAAESERQSATADDSYIPHSLPEEAVETIVRKIRYYEEIQQIYLVRKEMKHFSEIDFNVLFLRLRSGSVLQNRGDMKAGDVLNAVAERLAGIEIGYFQILDASFKNKLPQIERIPGAVIFDREKEA